MTYYFPYSWGGKFSVILLLQKRFGVNPLDETKS